MCLCLDMEVFSHFTLHKTRSRVFRTHIPSVIDTFACLRVSVLEICEKKMWKSSLTDNRRRETQSDTFVSGRVKRYVVSRRLIACHCCFRVYETICLQMFPSSKRLNSTRRPKTSVCNMCGKICSILGIHFIH